MIRRNWRAILIFIALSIDIITIVLSGMIAYFIRGYIPNLPSFPEYVYFQLCALFGSSLIIIAMLVGVYRTTFHSNTIGQYFLAVKAYIFVILFLFSILYLLQYDRFPQRFTILFFFILPFVFATGRIGLNKFIKHMQNRGYGIHNVIIAGYDNGGISIIERFKSFPELGYNIRGIVTNQKRQYLDPIEIHGTMVPKFHISELDRIISDYKIDRVFIPSTSVISNGYTQILEVCKRRRIKLKTLSPESEELLRFSRVHDIAGITLFAPKRQRIDRAKKIIKRLFDIFGSSLLIVILSPLFLLIMLAVLFEDGMPIFFTQKRALVSGHREFRFIKFRSMIKGAELKQSDLYKFNEVSGGLFLMKDDPRITKVGKVLRMFSLDELPQLFNVLIGDMSLVGPRPLSIADLNNIAPENKLGGHYKLRANAKPGITGLWQISGRREISFKEMVLIDLYYIENQSLVFDLEILFATIPVVLFGKGAY